MSMNDKSYNALAKVSAFFAWLSVVAFVVFLFCLLYVVAVIVF